MAATYGAHALGTSLSSGFGMGGEGNCPPFFMGAGPLLRNARTGPATLTPW